MSKRKFSLAERHAIYTVHGEKCHIGHEAITLREMQVDHVIPEHLREEPHRLSQVLLELGLPADFELNSYENWLPSCGRCNNEKRSQVFRLTPLIQHHLDQARERAPRVKAVVETIVSNRELSKALTAIERALESGRGADQLRVEIERLAALASQYREPELRKEPFRIDRNLIVVHEDETVRVISGPYGIGGGPINPSRLACCGVCGAAAWNGARCVVCGNMDDGD